MERNLRPRSAGQYLSQQEFVPQEEEDFILGRKYNVLEKFNNPEYQSDHGYVSEMDGKDFTMKYVQDDGLSRPIVFRDTSGLGMSMPASQLTVADVKKLVGSRRKVDVMDTLTQDSISMTLGQWTKYYETFPRERILNIISLEFSCTKLDPHVQAPKIVRQLDWVEQVWPADLKNLQTSPTNDLNKMMYPKVQKYCLMSVAGCFTDFHIDFGGTSVWYHVLRGEKQFLLIPPSPDAYSIFQHWQMSGEQEGVFLAELIGKAQLVHLHAGDTFIMPSGWIHAVYTPSDSLVFGGNFLHSFNIAQQLTVAALEDETKVPLKLRYPFYGTIHWYVLWKYMTELKKLARKVRCKSADDSGAVVAPQLTNPNRRWLKQVSMERLTPSDNGDDKPSEKMDLSQREGSQSCEGESGTAPVVGNGVRTLQEHQRDKDSVKSMESDPLPESGSNTIKSLDTAGDPVIEFPSSKNKDVITPNLLEERPGNGGTQDEGPADGDSTKHHKEDELPKPHLSSHERGGLLFLVHKMKNSLFHLETPTSISSSHDLIASLEKLLQSALSADMCSFEPSGVGVVNITPSPSQSTPLKCRKRSISPTRCLASPKKAKLDPAAEGIETTAHSEADNALGYDVLRRLGMLSEIHTGCAADTGSVNQPPSAPRLDQSSLVPPVRSIAPSTSSSPPPSGQPRQVSSATSTDPAPNTTPSSTSFGHPLPTVIFSSIPTSSTNLDKAPLVATIISSPSAKHPSIITLSPRPTTGRPSPATPPSVAIGSSSPANPPSVAPGRSSPSVTTGRSSLANPPGRSSLANPPSVVTGKSSPSVATGKSSPSVATGKSSPSVATGKSSPSVATGKSSPSVATGKLSPSVATVATGRSSLDNPPSVATGRSSAERLSPANPPSVATGRSSPANPPFVATGRSSLDNPPSVATGRSSPANPPSVTTTSSSTANPLSASSSSAAPPSIVTASSSSSTRISSPANPLSVATLSFTTLPSGQLSATLSLPGGGGQFNIPFAIAPATLSSLSQLNLFSKPITAPPALDDDQVMCAASPSLLGERGEFQEVIISKIPNPAVTSASSY